MLIHINARIYQTLFYMKWLDKRRECISYRFWFNFIEFYKSILHFFLSHFTMFNHIVVKCFFRISNWITSKTKRIKKIEIGKKNPWWWKNKFLLYIFISYLTNKRKLEWTREETIAKMKEKKKLSARIQSNINHTTVFNF